MKKIIYTLFILFSTNQAYAQVGIGTNNPDNSAMLEVQSTARGILFPRMTSAQRNGITSPAVGLQVYDTNTNSLWYFNGTYWVNSKSEANEGDVKSGIQTNDHSGWVLLDGRVLTSLSANQQAAASSLGLTGNLPNATNAYLSQNGGTMASISGANTTTLTQANLPSVSFTGTAANAGNHTHTIDPAPVNTSTNGNHTHGSNANGGNGAGLQYGSGNNTPTSLDNSDNGGLEDDLNYTAALNIYYNGNHNHTVDIPATTSTNAGAHTHSVTVASGGSATPINIAPRSLTVNMFIYLGL